MSLLQYRLSFPNKESFNSVSIFRSGTASKWINYLQKDSTNFDFHLNHTAKGNHTFVYTF